MGSLAGEGIYISGRPSGLVSEMRGFWSDFPDITCLHLYCSKLLSLKVFQAAVYHCGNTSPVEKSRWAPHFKLGRELAFWACLVSKLDLGPGVCLCFGNSIVMHSARVLLRLGAVRLAQEFLYVGAVMVQWMHRICVSNTFFSDCQCPTHSVLGQSSY